MQAEKAEIDRQLADPALYNGAGEDVTALTRKAAELERAIDDAETAWLKAQEALDQAAPPA